MSHPPGMKWIFGLAAALAGAAGLVAQGTPNASNDTPNPYQTIEGWAKMPEGRTWGSTSAVEIDRDGVSVWVGERCGANSCAGSTLDPILKFDATGKLIKSFGSGMVFFPHGIFVDRDGNVWITDGQDNAPRGRGTASGGAAAATGTTAPATTAGGAGTPATQGAGRGAGSGAAAGGGPNPAATKGHQVFKFSPDGQLLLTLGKPGGALEPEYFFQPNDVLVAPNGDIFVAEGHGGPNSRILKFDSSGKFLQAFGKKGTGPGEFDQPHSLAMDSQGRLFVGDRTNNRVQILDQTGTFIAEWKQFGRPSGVYIDRNDMLYVADSEAQSRDANAYGYNPGVKRGIRIGSAKTGIVTAFIPDPSDGAGGTSAAEGVAVDRDGVVYGAEVGPRALKRYVRN